MLTEHTQIAIELLPKYFCGHEKAIVELLVLTGKTPVPKIVNEDTIEVIDSKAELQTIVDECSTTRYPNRCFHARAPLQNGNSGLCQAKWQT